MKPHADLKAWCHWKRKEKDLSEDDELFVKAVEDAISQAGMAATFRERLAQVERERDDYILAAGKVAKQLAETTAREAFLLRRLQGIHDLEIHPAWALQDLPKAGDAKKDPNV